MSLLRFDRRSEVAPSLPEVLDTPSSSWHVGGGLGFSHHQPSHLPVPGTSPKLLVLYFPHSLAQGAVHSCMPFASRLMIVLYVPYRGFFFPRHGAPMITRGWRKPSPATEQLPQPQLCQMSFMRQRLGLHWCIYLCSGPHYPAFSCSHSSVTCSQHPLHQPASFTPHSLPLTQTFTAF